MGQKIEIDEKTYDIGTSEEDARAFVDEYVDGNDLSALVREDQIAGWAKDIYGQTAHARIFGVDVEADLSYAIYQARAWKSVLEANKEVISKWYKRSFLKEILAFKDCTTPAHLYAGTLHAVLYPDGWDTFATSPNRFEVKFPTLSDYIESDSVFIAFDEDGHLDEMSEKSLTSALRMTYYRSVYRFPENRYGFPSHREDIQTVADYEDKYISEVSKEIIETCLDNDRDWKSNTHYKNLLYVFDSSHFPIMYEINADWTHAK